MKTPLFYIFCCALVLALAGMPVHAQTFTNVIEECGMNFSHSLDGTCPGPPVGSGSAWADYDNDGDLDLYITNHGGPSSLFRNEGDTSGDGIPDFIDVAPSLGVDEAGQIGHGVCFADYDNDGDQDLYVTHWGGNTFYRNDLVETGSVAFVDITATAGVGDADRALTAAWGDFDQDGWLDLYLAKHFDCLPNTRESRDRLFKNNGDGTFTDVSSYLCADGSLTCPELNNSHAFTAGWTDLDNDNDLDLYIASDVIAAGWPNILWRNDGPNGSGGWTFVEIGASSGTDYSINCMGLGVGDYDNDGWMDLAFSHALGGFLLHNDGNATDMHFTDVSPESGARGLYTPGGAPAVTWGTVFFDYDNDQWLDLFYVRGMISALTTPQPDFLLHNNQDGLTFTEVSIPAGVADDRRGRSASIADFDQDGFVDLFVGNYGWPVDLWHNNEPDLGNTNHWLKVTAQGSFHPVDFPVGTNRDGIGARFYLTTADGITQMRDISSGPTHGGGDYKMAYFGMGQWTEGTLSMRWPTGEVRDLGIVQADQHINVVEDTMTVGVDENDPVASQFRLSQNYPNPFNPSTRITYSLPTASNVSLKVYDALGQEVMSLVDGIVSAGSHQVELNASELSSGLYFYRLTAGSFTDSKKLVVLK